MARSLSIAEKKLREVEVAYPIGPRGWRHRAIFSLAAIAAAGLLAVPGNVSTPQNNPSFEQAQAQAEVVAAGADDVPLAKDAIAITEAPVEQKMTVALTPQQAELRAPFVELGAMDSTEGETRDGFMVRVAQTMDMFTRTTQHEVCGVIMVNSDETAWRVRLTTNRSHIACVMVVFDESGYVRMGQDIHSHPRIVGGAQANAQDIIRRRDFSCGETIHIFDEAFSRVDFDRGPGYLVSRGRLLYQHGKNWPIQQVATFDAIDADQSPELAKGGINPTLTPELAAAAWQNQDVEGVPSTSCPPIEPVLAPVIEVIASEEDKVAAVKRRAPH